MRKFFETLFEHRETLVIGSYTVILVALAVLVLGDSLASANVWWASYVADNGLVPYVDFRPGYPPLGGGLYILTLGYLRFSPVVPIIAQVAVFCLTVYFLRRLIGILAPLSMGRAYPLLLMPGLAFGVLFTNDVFSSFSMVLALYLLVRGRSFWAGVAISAGFFAKIYPALLAVPVLLLLIRTSRKEGEQFFGGLALATLLMATPFLALEPFMLATTFLQHFFRGPADTIFALVENYQGHTGFLHPTFDATLYYWDFRALYAPSRLDHFAYSWNMPWLPYLSLLCQGSVVSIPFIKKRLAGQASWPMVAGALVGFFAFASVYVPQFEVALVPLIVLSTLTMRFRNFLTVLIFIDLANILDYTVWGFLPIPLGTLRPAIFVLEIGLRTALLFGVAAQPLLGLSKVGEPR